MTILILLGWFLLASVVTPFLKKESLLYASSLFFGILGSIGVFGLVWYGWKFGWQSVVSIPWALSPFAALMLVLIAIVYLAAVLVSQRYLRVEFAAKIFDLGHIRRFFALQHLFMLAMLAAVLADHMGIIWIALEGATLATTLLVSFYRKDGAVEAAWKYIILCSVGMTLGLFGILLFVHAAIQAGLGANEALSLTHIRTVAAHLDPTTMKWAFVFIFVGLGTKVGFVPMHTWLPDAYSKTPSPISAMLSGALSSIAFLTILRFQTIVNITLTDSKWTSHLFAMFGLISVVFAAFILLQSRNYKRTLAYSSIEHAGLMAFAVSLGPIGMVPAIIHMIGHTLAKSLLFFEAGEVLLAYHTTKTEGVSGLQTRLPITSRLGILGLLALLAVPPSPLFLSELLILSLGMQVRPWMTACLVIALTIIAYGMIRTALQMWAVRKPRETGSGSAGDGHVAHTEVVKEPFHITHAVALAQIILLIGAGLILFTRPGLQGVRTIAQSLSLPL